MEKDSQTKFNLGGLGCLGSALIIGFVLGLTIGGRAFPDLRWLSAVSFALLFGVLTFVFTGISLRRDRGIITETIMAIPPKVAASLKLAIEQANPPSHLSLPEVSMLDADLAELGELIKRLEDQPRLGSHPAVKKRLEELAMKWLDEEALMEWLASVEP